MGSFPVVIEYDVAIAGGVAGQQPFQQNAVFAGVTNVMLTDKLNVLKTLEFDIPNDDFHAANSYIERVVNATFITPFRGIITGRQVNQQTIHLITSEFAWHFTRRTFRQNTLARISYSAVLTNLHLWYQFEQNINDTQGNLNLTLAAGTPVYVGGTEATGQYALQTDGVVSLTASDAGLSSGTTDRSVTFWFKPASFASNQTIFGYGTNTANHEFGCYVNTSGKIVFVGSSNDVTSTAALTTGTWYHIALCMAQAGTLRKIYINGVQDSSFNTTALNTTLGGTFSICSGNFGIGKMLNQGQIDGFKMWNGRFLSSIEVQQIFANTLPPTPSTVKEVTSGQNVLTDILTSANADMPAGVTWIPRPPNPWRQYQCHFDTGDALDLSGMNNHGTVTSGCTFIAGQNTGSQAIKFNGATDKVTFNTAISLSQQDYSAGAWILTPFGTPGGTYNAIMRGTNDLQICVRVSDHHLGAFISGTFYDSGFDVSTLTANWHFFNIVSTQVSGTTVFYVDGVVVGTIAHKSQDNVIEIGGDGTNQSIMTAMDDFQWWTRPISLSEVLILWAGGDIDPFVFPEVAMDFNYKSHWEALQSLSINMAVDLWFDNQQYVVYMGSKGKNLNEILDIQIDTNPTTTTDNYANMINLLGKPISQRSQLELQVVGTSSLAYNYEKVVSDQTMATTDMMTNIGGNLLNEFGVLNPTIDGTVLFTQFVRYDLNTGDVVILSLPDRQIVGTYRVTQLKVDQVQAAVSFESTLTDTLRTRSLNTSDIISSLVTRILQGDIVH